MLFGWKKKSVDVFEVGLKRESRIHDDSQVADLGERWSSLLRQRGDLQPPGAGPLGPTTMSSVLFNEGLSLARG